MTAENRICTLVKYNGDACPSVLYAAAEKTLAIAETDMIKATYITPRNLSRMHHAMRIFAWCRQASALMATMKNTVTTEEEQAMRTIMRTICCDDLTDSKSWIVLRGEATYGFHGRDEAETYGDIWFWAKDSVCRVRFAVRASSLLTFPAQCFVAADCLELAMQCTDEDLHELLVHLTSCGGNASVYTNFLRRHRTSLYSNTETRN